MAEGAKVEGGLEEAWVRQGGRVDAWARVRPSQEKRRRRACVGAEGIAGRVWRVQEREQDRRRGAKGWRGEERRGGRDERVGRVGGFAGSLLLIFPVRLAASSFRSWSSSSCPPTAPSIALAFPLSLLTDVSVPRIRLPPTPPSLPFSHSLAPSLPSCSLMPHRPSTLDPRSLLLSVSPFSPLYAFASGYLSFRCSSPRSLFVSRSFSRSFLLYLLSRVFLRDLISLSFFLSYT